MITWVANVLLVIGYWQTIARKRWALWLTIAGELCYMVVSFGTDWALFTVCAVFGAIAFHGWWVWKDLESQ